MKLALCVFAVGCSAAPADEVPDVTSGEYHHYVTSGLRIPTSGELQREYGLNIDGDAAGRPDNQLGNVFVALTSNSDADLQGEIDGSIADGSLVVLHSVRADDLAKDGSVSWQVYLGEAAGAPPRWDGSDRFELAPGSSTPIIGHTQNGSYDGKPAGAGELTLAIDVSSSAPPITLGLIKARVEATVDANGCTGRMGGAITKQQVDTVLIPSVVQMMNAAIARDPGCPSACMTGTSAALIVDVFDKDKDGTITEDEVRNSSIIQTLLAPDLDLLDDSGAFEPDGIEDSISLGVGFDCVAAVFTEAP